MLHEKFKRKLVKNEVKDDDSFIFKHQLRYTKAEPSISFSENPRHSRAKKKLKRESPTKVKIFLEFPEEIYKFETGCSDEDELNLKFIAVSGDKKETRNSKTSEDLEEKLVAMEEAVGLNTPTKAVERSKFTPQKLQNKPNLLPPSSRQFQQQRTPLKVAFVARTPPRSRSFENSHFIRERRFSVYGAPPTPRQPPTPFLLPQVPETIRRNRFENYESLEHHKRFRSPEDHRRLVNKHFRHSPSPRYDDCRYNLRNNRENSNYHRRSENRHENSSQSYNSTSSKNQSYEPRSTPESFRNSTHRETLHQRSNSISPNQSLVQVSKEKTRLSSPKENNEEVRKSAEKLPSHQDAQHSQKRKSIEVTKSKVDPENRSDVTYKEVPRSSIPHKNSSAQAYKSISSPEKLALLKKKQRKIERDLKRAEKELRKMKLRKMIKELEEADDNAYPKQQTKRCSNDQQLLKLQNFNVFAIGKNPMIASNNQSLESRFKIVPKKKKIRSKEKFKSLPPPPPPTGAPPSHLYQPTRRNLFMALPVDLEPMIQKTLENMNSLQICLN